MENKDYLQQKQDKQTFILHRRYNVIKCLYSGTCQIWHNKGPGKCFRLYRMLEYSGFILVNRNTLGP